MNAKKILTPAMAMAALSITTAQADTIADWTFETSAPTTVGPLTPEVGSGSALFGSLGPTNSTVSSPAGNASTHSFSVNGWDVGEYFQFSVSTIGFEDINISLDEMGSNTGPKNFDFAYSINGTDFTTFSSYSVTNDSWTATGTAKSNSTHTFDLSSVTSLDDLSTVYFRVIDNSTTAITLGTVASAGTDRIDNFIVGGTLDATPEPSTIALATLSGLGCLFMLRRKS